VVLPDQGDIAPYGKVRDQGGIRGDEPDPRLMGRDKILQSALQFPFAIEES